MKKNFEKFIKSHIKTPKDMLWLLPGLQVKRWFALIFFGTSAIIIGVLILMNLRPVYFLMTLLIKLFQNFSSEIIGFVCILFGVFLFIKGWIYANYSLLGASDSRKRHELLESVYRRRMLNRGPKIVAIGGGTGLSTLLKGLKNLTNNITAVVTVGDDGGSSGRLRHELGVLPPGDIRNCIAALADDEDLVTKLFQYRFKTGEGLEGHSFGNLFLSALCSITGDMVNAVMESSKVLSIRGRVLPSTLDDMKLVAKMDTGEIVCGESNIPEAKGKIEKIYTDPINCRALKDVLLAIEDAELIILGPGSLYTSVIPNLLIKDISLALAKSKAKKIYICNIMTQPGETDGFSVSDHIKTINEHADVNKNLIDAVLVNDTLNETLVEEYKKVNSYPVILDAENVKSMNIEVVKRKLLEDNTTTLVRHSPKRIARAIYYWYKKSLKSD